MVFDQTKTLFWYLKRPKLYPQLLHVMYQRLFLLDPSQENTKQESELWCAENSIDTNTVIERITGAPMSGHITEMFPDIFALAHKQAADCPVKMGGAGNLDLIYWIAEYTKARKVVETGVAYGWSSLAFLLSLRHRPDSILISTDKPYVRLNNDQYVGCVVPTELRIQWQIIPYADRQALPKALKQLGTVDICHYDSDKTYQGRMWAYPRMWAALRNNGVLISDDIGDNIAFRDFSHAVAVEPIVVRDQGKYAGVLVKPGD